MDRYKKHECKLCNKIISDQNFGVIENATKKVFDLLLLKLTLEKGTLNVMCMACSSKLFSALNFKSTCLYTNNTIAPYINFENSAPVDLKEVHAERVQKQRGGMFDNREICRLCLNPISENLKSIQEVPVETIRIYIPEINFAVTKNPVICIKCHDALCLYSSFIKNCLEVEKERNPGTMDVGNTHVTEPCIKTEEIEIKPEPIEDDATLSEMHCKQENKGDISLHSQNSLAETEESKRDMVATYVGDILLTDPYMKAEETDIKPDLIDDAALSKILCDQEKQENEEGHTLLLSRYGLTETEETRSMYDPDNLKPTSTNYEDRECIYKTPFESRLALALTANKKEGSSRETNQCIDRNRLKTATEHEYQCGKCVFKTKHRKSVQLHQLVHKDDSEVEMFECGECDFKNKRIHSVQRHQLLHKNRSDVPVYKCDRCDYKTILKSNLPKHQLRHKDPSEVNMWKCHRCQFETKRKWSLKKHLLRHKDLSQVQVAEPKAKVNPLWASS